MAKKLKDKEIPEVTNVVTWLKGIEASGLHIAKVKKNDGTYEWEVNLSYEPETIVIQD